MKRIIVYLLVIMFTYVGYTDEDIRFLSAPDDSWKNHTIDFSNTSNYSNNYSTPPNLQIAPQNNSYNSYNLQKQQQEIEQMRRQQETLEYMRRQQEMNRRYNSLNRKMF